MKRVRWSVAEKGLLTEKANELLAKGERSPLVALRRSQSVLPVKRRRTLLHIGQAPWFVEGQVKERDSARVDAAAAAASGYVGSGAMREHLVEFFAGVLREAMLRSGSALSQTRLNSHRSVVGSPGRRR